jgi:pimeloyl-ACP methyl ester carboxylesterase
VTAALALIAVAAWLLFVAWAVEPLLPVGLARGATIAAAVALRALARLCAAVAVPPIAAAGALTRASGACERRLEQLARRTQERR